MLDKVSVSSLLFIVYSLCESLFGYQLYRAKYRVNRQKVVIELSFKR